MPETVLLEVSATATDPVSAMRAANAVSEALSDAVSSLERPSASAPPLAKVTVVTSAEASAKPVSPRILRTVLLAMFCGAVLGTVAAYIYYRVRNTIDWVEGVSEVSGKPVLGDIPLDDSLPANGALDFNAGASESAEAFRKLRTNLGFSNIDGSSRVILITSPSQADGKTTTAINLAAAVAESGKRVVLVDTDLRRPSVARRFGAIEGIGLTDYLRGSLSVVDVTQTVGIDGLDILGSGPLPPNPAELLESHRTRECFLELAEIYDYVIVDSPPILPVTDAMVAAQWADGVVVVVRAGKTRRSALETVLAQLQVGSRTVFGVVLNGVEASRRQYRYYYGAGTGGVDVDGVGSRVSSKAL
ncbi:polysaccharide biosynthesis tyrosine autokinase [Gordonia sp. CNJ-863]|uniref:polysaccharide biosynthesis tyrosine autokinase n=1 Tax=Gordonia sp. CNJ-863 TaxID=1904963 RepID=UPI0013011CBA|nr:polysaccharide biosynthesis tyrosine autokinase [Gordonia sp. CNJ-863]